MTKEQAVRKIKECPYRSVESIDFYFKGEFEGMHIATCNLDYKPCPSNECSCYSILIAEHT